MTANIKLGKILGIQIGLHYSWLIIALLITLSLRTYFSTSHPEWGDGIIWTMAVVSAVMFFAAIIVHELSHALVALKNDLPVSSITLFALGGVAQIEKEAETPWSEFWLGIVGPITSAVIGAVCLGVAMALGWPFGETPATPLMAILVWLGTINIALAVFNMIPGFPMDGGRVLRAAVWRGTGDRFKATRIAAVVGQVLAIGFIVLGVLAFFGGSGIGGLWIAFIGWFLLNSAKATYSQSEISERLRDLAVRDLMTSECEILDGRTNLQTLVEEHMLKSGQRCFIVTGTDGPQGLITPNEVKEVAREMWPMTVLADVMKPLEKLHTVRPETSVMSALETMGREDINQMPVMADGKLAGMISRDQIVKYLYTRRELDI
jgi:Zn-dependent protease/predicted transcriptional regulator